MSAGLIVALSVTGLLIIIFIAIYNGLVSARQRVKESWSDVDTELKRRHDLIPNLVATVKGYMTHEKEVLERLTELRQEAGSLRPGLATAGQAHVEGQLGMFLGMIRMRMEAYPDLKASGNALSLQAELANTEDRIAGALRYYNGNVRDLNVKTETFPSTIVASLFHFKPAEYFKLDDSAAREAPDVRLDPQP